MRVRWEQTGKLPARKKQQLDFLLAVMPWVCQKTSPAWWVGVCHQTPTTTSHVLHPPWNSLISWVQWQKIKELIRGY